VSRIFNAVRPFHERAQRGELIRHFVKMASSLAEECLRHLSGQTQHRFVRAERRQQGSTGIEHAGPGHDAEHADPPRRSCIAECHVAAGLLVPRADDFQLSLLECVEQAIDLRARQPEHGIDPMRHKAADDRFAARTYGHDMIQSCTGHHAASSIMSLIEVARKRCTVQCSDSAA
jgi:hypothetical protein